MFFKNFPFLHFFSTAILFITLSCSSLNFFEDNSTLNNSKKVKNIMKKLSSFKLELKDTSKEKKSLTTPGSFEDDKLSKDQEKQLENKIIN